MVRIYHICNSARLSQWSLQSHNFGRPPLISDSFVDCALPEDAVDENGCRVQSCECICPSILMLGIYVTHDTQILLGHSNSAEYFVQSCPGHSVPNLRLTIKSSSLIGSFETLPFLRIYRLIPQ